MPDLTNPKIVKEILSKNNFNFKKSLGQNFLINPSVCPKMAEAAVPNEGYGVIEIGPGIGVLTAELAKRARRVVAVEIDERLKPVLAQTLSEFDNAEVVFGDVCKIDLAELIKQKFGTMPVVICANLPYYITSPIIMMLLESALPIESVTVMVQKEAADRLCADIGSREAGAVSVAVSYYSEPQHLFKVSRGSFMPAPNVDSEVIKLNIRKTPPVELLDKKLFFKVVKTAFSQRRKTFVNSVSSVMKFPKSELIEILNELQIPEDIRAEKLTINQLADISNMIKQKV